MIELSEKKRYYNIYYNNKSGLTDTEKNKIYYIKTHIKSGNCNYSKVKIFVEILSLVYL